jgi:DNA-binding transcriptional ArsR family regulator
LVLADDKDLAAELGLNSDQVAALAEYCGSSQKGLEYFHKFEKFSYNIFMTANISSVTSEPLAEIFHLLGQPARIQIVLILARREACVCHLEAALGLRQAAISQNLMALRDAGLVTTERCGRNIFYRLANPALAEAIYQLAASTGISSTDLERLSTQPVANCPCPHCNPGMAPDRAC